MLILISIIESLLGAAAVFLLVGRKAGAASGNLGNLETEVQTKQGLVDEVRQIISEMVHKQELFDAGVMLRTLRDAVKTERGRITITKAELETVETRLRELEEIEREIEASGIETKEELNILQKKEKDLRNKNEALKAQINASCAQMDELMAQIETSSLMQEHVQNMKMELLQTQEKIDTLLLQVEQGNEQYFVMKQRYDALDIEYAQLFEKFSEFEEKTKEK